MTDALASEGSLVFPEPGTYEFLGRQAFQQVCQQAIVGASGPLSLCLSGLDGWALDSPETHELLKAYWRRHATHHTRVLLFDAALCRALEGFGRFGRFRMQYAHKLTCWVLDSPRDLPAFQAMFAGNFLLTQVSPVYFNGSLQVGHDAHSRGKISELTQLWERAAPLSSSVLGL
jgi:hypothetical protein